MHKLSKAALLTQEGPPRIRIGPSRTAVISPETINLVRDRTDIVAIISEAVPSLKKRGRSFVGLCPFHQEKSPSFHVNADRGFFHCFGCKESGGVFDFLIKQEGYTFPEAVRALAERAGIPIEEARDYDSQQVDRARKAKEELFAANQIATSWFEMQLREHPLRQFAIDELARRELKPVDEVVSAFRLGYAPHSWDGLALHLRSQGISPIVAEQVGLLAPRSSGTGHYDRFRHRLMFPVIDVHGKVIAFSGRALKDPPDSDAKGDPPPKYVNSPESPIYTKGHALFGLFQARHQIRNEECAILVEGNFDVVSLHARGITNVVAPLGTAFTTDQAKLLHRFAERVVLFFDGDSAGRKATLAARESCRDAGLSARVANVQEGKDPDDLVRSRGAAHINELVKGARGMLEYLLENMLDGSFSQADVYERAHRIERVAKLLSEENDPVVRSMAKSYADQLAGRLDMVRSSEAFRALEQQVKRALAQATTERGPLPREARIKAREPGAAERTEIVGALIEFPELLDDEEVSSHLDLLEGLAVTALTALRRATFVAPSGSKSLDSQLFLDQIPVSLQAFASARLAAPEHETEKQARETLINNLTKLRKLVLSREHHAISREAHAAEGDWERTIELARDAQTRVRLLQGIKNSD